jgi:hypothetical protein
VIFSLTFEDENKILPIVYCAPTSRFNPTNKKDGNFFCILAKIFAFCEFQ